jgi:type IV pilus assembly protein PilF
MSRRPAVARAWVLLIAALLPGMASADSSQRQKISEAAKTNAELALAYMREGDLKSAREKIDKALKQDSRTAETQMAAGFVYDRLGEDRKAARFFSEAVRLGGKDNPDVLNNAAVFECRKGSKKQGVEYFLRAAKSPLYRTPEVAYANAGFCAREDGRPEEAEQYFRQAIGIRPTLADPLYQLADLSLETGKLLQARAFMQRYNAAAAASPASLWLGYRIESGLQDPVAAGDYARRLRTEFPTSAETGKLLEAERQAQ